VREEQIGISMNLDAIPTLAIYSASKGLLDKFACGPKKAEKLPEMLSAYMAREDEAESEQSAYMAREDDAESEQ